MLVVVFLILTMVHCAHLLLYLLCFFISSYINVFVDGYIYSILTINMFMKHLNTLMKFRKKVSSKYY